MRLLDDALRHAASGVLVSAWIHLRSALGLRFEHNRENQGLASQSAIAIAVALVLLPSASRADKWPNCTYDTRSIEYAQCAIRELNKELTDLRQQMNDRYREVVAQIPEKAVDLRRHLEDAQTAWLRYATESCAFEGMTRGGSREAVEISTLECLSRETRARAGALGQIRLSLRR